MKHPRAADVVKLLEALEASGRPVRAVEMRWHVEDGREVPAWRFELHGEEVAPKDVKLG